MQFDFEWDPQKARSNIRKHGINFQQAATVFRDPKALSIYDPEHSATEDRWITVGLAASGRVIVVHHTFREIDPSTVRIRIFSSRKATSYEERQYLE